MYIGNFSEFVYEAKFDNGKLEYLLNQLEPVLKKYSIVNGFFYEDLYNRLIEVTINVVKRWQ